METGQGPSSSTPASRLDDVASDNVGSTHDLEATDQDVAATATNEEVSQVSVPHFREGMNRSPGPALQEVNGNATKSEGDENAQESIANATSKPSPSACVSNPQQTNGTATGGLENGEASHADKGVRFGADEERVDHDEALPQMGPAVGKKKKKKSKKPKSQRGVNAPTGFEEYYVDAPLTPAEFAEERDLYDLSRSFVERIETAIQRYRAKRNMNSDKRNLFDKWLTFGGIDSSPKQFTGGLDSQLLADSTAQQIAAFTAVNFVNEDLNFQGPDARYEVDFDGVVRSFLSSRLEKQFDCSTKDQVEGWCNIIRNFMNYLLHHDVCPEYNGQIFAARDSCDLAAEQIWNCLQAITSLPGDFNMACSTLFGGFYYDTYNEEQQAPPGSGRSMFGMSKDRARTVFEFGLTAHCDEALFNRYQTQVAAKEVSMNYLGDLGLEVIAIEMPSEEAQNLYANLPTLDPSGVLRARSWKIPGTDATKDLTPEERRARRHAKEVVKEYEFWIQEPVLKRMFLGMKLVIPVREMSFGVHYMDNCLNAFCSFFEVLPNELMLKHKAFQYLEPRAKESYDEDQGYGEEQTNQQDEREQLEGELQNEEQGQTVEEKGKGKAKAVEEEDQTRIEEQVGNRLEGSGNKQDTSTTESPPKWHYEEINGELCFVPYEDPAVDDDESELDDDDKINTIVNNHTSATAHDWSTHDWPSASNDTQYIVLNPDTDPNTMELDTWAKRGDPADAAASVNRDYDSESEDDDDEPRLGEYVLKEEILASGIAPTLASNPPDPKTPARVTRESGDAINDKDEDGDDSVELSPATEKVSARILPEMAYRYKVETFKDDMTGWREDMEERLQKGSAKKRGEKIGDASTTGEEKETRRVGTTSSADSDGDGRVGEDGGEGSSNAN